MLYYCSMCRNASSSSSASTSYLRLGALQRKEFFNSAASASVAGGEYLLNNNPIMSLHSSYSSSSASASLSARKKYYSITGSIHHPRQQQQQLIEIKRNHGSTASASQKFNFDTYKLVRQLERNGLFTRGQAVAMMRTINVFLVDSTLSSRQTLISSSDMENDVYFHKSQLQKLRNELSGLRQNDSTTLKEDSLQIMREIEVLDQRFTDQLIQLKADISLTLSLHKSESKEVTGEVDLRIQEIHHALGLKISELKTANEAMKVDLTTHFIQVLFICFGGFVLIDWALKVPPATGKNHNSSE